MSFVVGVDEIRITSLAMNWQPEAGANKAKDGASSELNFLTTLHRSQIQITSSCAVIAANIGE